MLKTTLCSILHLLARALGCPACSLYRLPITSAQITSGMDSGIPEVDLFWDQSVTYALDAEAAREFKFKQGREALTLVAQERSVLGDVDVKTTDAELTITIRRNTGPWRAKATLYFTALGDKKPAPGGLDPSVKNYGKPH